jgi:hypothetical protein
LLEDAELFKNLIPLDILESLPLPLLRRLRELQRKRRAYRTQQQNVSGGNHATGNINIDTSALSELLMDEM